VKVKLPDPGNEMYYDPQFFKEFLRSTMFFWRESYIYASCWRNLHIDGFEGRIFARHDLPVSSGKKLQFFQYAEAK
jgi:hypothetical protein